MRHELDATPLVSAWVDELRDERGRLAIAKRLSRFERGLFGDVKSVGGAVREARVNIGPGYRLYYALRGERVVLLLGGGDKGSQARDIAAARELAAEFTGD